MSLDADQVVERRRLKRRLTLWRVIGVVAVVAALLAGMGRFDLDSGDHVARILVQGIIIDDQDRDKALAAVAKDDHAKALIVKIDSPGGTYVGGEALFETIRQVADKKPVIALMGTTATSAGYMTALAADHILARSSSLTGSIGVIMQTADVTKLLDKVGIKPISVKSAPLKAQPNPLEEFSPAARKATEDVVADYYDMFLDVVEERRKLPRDTVKALADGRVFSGRQALANGLIDAIGAETEARKWLDETHKIAESLPVQDVEVGDDDEPWRKWVDSKIEKVLFSERLSLDGVISLWQPNLW
ncbi:MAG: signal peptide peptidase SppA [Alphaproteobacteria bacterium]|jgi:protease IV|nr:signal peptide peptidase SppA [Alphaproteobacteria bacterium]